MVLVIDAPRSKCLSACLRRKRVKDETGAVYAPGIAMVIKPFGTAKVFFGVRKCFDGIMVEEVWRSLLMDGNFHVFHGGYGLEHPIPEIPGRDLGAGRSRVPNVLCSSFK